LGEICDDELFCAPGFVMGFFVCVTHRHSSQFYSGFSKWMGM